MDGVCQRGSRAAGCDSELTPIGFHRLIAAGGAVTDASHGVTPSPVSDCGKIQKNLSVWVKQRCLVFGPSLAVRELLVTTLYVSPHQGAVCF